MAFSSKYQPLRQTGDDVDEEKEPMLHSPSIPPHSPQPWERYLTIFYVTLLLLILTNLALFAVAAACKTGRFSRSLTVPWQDARTLPKPDQYVGLEGDHYGNASYATVPYRRSAIPVRDSEVQAAGTVLYASN